MGKVITSWLPVFAKAKFVLKKPAKWDEWGKDEQDFYFVERAQCIGAICADCNKGLQGDLEIDHDALDGVDLTLFEGKL